VSVVIVGFARTPFARYCGAFATIPATELGAHAARSALSRAGVRGDEVDRVVVGHGIQAATGQNPARQTAAAAGVPLTVPAVTLNAVCLSGMEAVVEGVRLIDNGEADVVLTVGQESMSLSPHALVGSRRGVRYGAIEVIDLLESDGLSDAFTRQSMGALTESRNVALQISREDQDLWAARSHANLGASLEFLSGEIEPLLVGDGGPRTIHADDGLRAATTIETLSVLPPAFGPGGSITAGTSSQISDGASAILLMRETLANERRIPYSVRVISHALVAGPDVSLHAQPFNAISAALKPTGFASADLAAVEINEAFAAVAIHSTRRLGVDTAIVNAHGGAISLGHPIGASGNRIVGHLARRLEAAGSGSIGAAGICGGGGQGSAIVLEAV
jgi:acetyl-CoA C-acetyltransferase